LSIEDKYDEVRELIIIGKQRGYLLYDEINDLLPEGICSSDELDGIFSLFGSADIEVIGAFLDAVDDTPDASESFLDALEELRALRRDKLASLTGQPED